jgi:dihydroorotase/N-acyl-D-amino-acid deacylase
MYAPGSSAPHDELVRLCQVVARHGKVYATHMRSYSHQLLESLEEQIALARESGCRLQISHLQAVGRLNWDKQARALELHEQAAAEGIDVQFDSYPYLAGSTVLTQLLPQSAMDGGIPQLLKLLDRPEERSAIAEATTRDLAQRWSDIFIASVGSERNQHLVGRSFEDLAEERGTAGVDTALDLLVEEKGVVNILSFNQSEENLRKLLSHPLCTVISDGFYVKGRPHPRLYGTFPCLLGEIARQRGWLTLAEAVHKITGKPALRFGLNNRGRLAVGYAADVVLFDPDRIAGRATYENPRTPPEGVTLVFRGGRQITPGR